MTGPGPDALLSPQTASLADAVRRIMAGTGFKRGIERFVAAFHRHAGDRQPLIYEAPPFTGNAQHDAYIAAVAEHLARSHDMPVPRWTQDARRFLNRPWFLPEGSMADTPVAFRKRMIYTKGDPLKQKTRPVGPGDPADQDPSP